MTTRAASIETIRGIAPALRGGATKTTALVLLGALALGAGCRLNPIQNDENRAPIAVARAIGPDGVPADGTVNAGYGPIFPFSGAPVEVTLDGSGSSDQDGEVVAYRWLSGTLVDGGSDRLVAEGAAPNWPDDRDKPVVALGEGVWAFTLSVTDDEGAVSVSDTIGVVIGEIPVPETPEGGMPMAVCNGVPCNPMVMLPGATMPSPGCCDMDSAGACGAVVSTMGDCEAVDQEGTDNPACPSEMSAAGTMIAGCCKPDGKCGVRSGVLRGCIERTDYPPAFLMSMMQLAEASCM
jgi:hypothetical protein